MAHPLRIRFGVVARAWPAVLAGAALAAAVLMVPGCATTRVKPLPDGQHGLVVDCSGASLTWSHCYRKAGEVCPLGYTIDKASRTGGGRLALGDVFVLVGAKPVHRRLLIDCKEGAVPVLPGMAGPPSAAH